MLDRNTFNEQLDRMRSAFKTTFNLNAQDEEVWYEELCDIPEELFTASISHMIRTIEAFPSIARIRNYALDAISSDHTEAWSILVRIAPQLTYKQILESDKERLSLNPILEIALERMGGPQFFANMLQADEGTHKAQFRKLWANLINERLLKQSVDKSRVLIGRKEQAKLKAVDSQIRLLGLSMKLD